MTTTARELDIGEEDECPHNYEFIEQLDSTEEDQVRELYGCILCAHERVVTHHIGVGD